MVSMAPQPSTCCVLTSPTATRASAPNTATPIQLLKGKPSLVGSRTPTRKEIFRDYDSFSSSSGSSEDSSKFTDSSSDNVSARPARVPSFRQKARSLCTKPSGIIVGTIFIHKKSEKERTTRAGSSTKVLRSSTPQTQRSTIPPIDDNEAGNEKRDPHFDTEAERDDEDSVVSDISCGCFDERPKGE